MRWRRSSSASAGAIAGAIALGGISTALISACGGGGETSNTVLQSPSGVWERVASMPQRRSYVAGAQVGSLVYAAGGMVGETGRPLATFSRYDTRRDAWSQLTPLPVP